MEAAAFLKRRQFFQATRLHITENCLFMPHPVRRALNPSCEFCKDESSSLYFIKSRKITYCARHFLLMILADTRIASCIRNQKKCVHERCLVEIFGSEYCPKSSPVLHPLHTSLYFQWLVSKKYVGGGGGRNVRG